LPYPPIKLSYYKKVPNHRSLPRFRQLENDVAAISEYPDVMIDASDVQPRFVDVDRRTFQQALDEN